MTDNENILFEKLENENVETLTKMGRGAELEKYCSWIGKSKHGIGKKKSM